MKLKVITVLGTRPEIIRLSAVIKRCNHYFDHKLVHTGQNYDRQLNDVFFDDLGLSSPDYYLDCNTKTLGSLLGDIFVKFESVLLKEKPDAVLALGDTNSALALVIAKRMKIPTYHMEAGNRSFDANVPEEINRKLVDHTADFNLVYTEHARRHLLSEGLPHRFIYLTGSPMREVLEQNKQAIENSAILKHLALTPKNYFIVSVHREENVDSRDNLKRVCSALIKLNKEYNVPVVVSTHPRTRNRLEQLDVDFSQHDIRFLEPFGFHDYNKLQSEALCAVSDSGTISEESAILRFPAVSIRQSIERPEALDTGSIVLTGLDENIILGAIKMVVDDVESANYVWQAPEEYLIENTSDRVVRLIQGTAKLANRWRNLDGFTRYDWE